MYRIVPKKSFIKDLNKIVQQGFDDEKLKEIFSLMMKGDKVTLGKMPYREHKLMGKYKDCFDLHIAGDIVLIYSYDENNKIIDLLRIGSHNQVFNK